MSNELNRQKTKKLFKSILIYAIGDFGTKILSFLIVPLYTYYISTGDMGEYDLLISTVSLLVPIVTLQIPDAAYRWLIQDIEPDFEYARSALQVVVFNSILVSIIVVVINYFISVRYYNYFIFILICSQLFNTLQKIARGIKNQRVFTESSIVYTVTYLFFNLIQICILNKGVIGLFTSSIAAYIFASCFILIREPLLQINIWEKINLKKIIGMIRFSVPLIPNQLNWWVINSSDRYIVRIFLGTSANGILSIAHKFPTMLQLLLGLFNTAWQDLSIADIEQDEEGYYTSVFQKFYKFSFGLLWILIPATKIFIDLVMSDAYKESANYVPFYYLGAVFQSFSSFYGVGYLKDKRTELAFTTSVYGTVVNVLVNVLLIRFIGLQAAAFSTFVGFLVMWLVREKQNKKELQIQIDKKEFIASLLCSMIMCILSIGLDIIQNIVLLLCGTCAFLMVNGQDLLVIIHIIIQKIREK